MFGDITEFNRLSRSGMPTGPVFVTYSDRTSALALLNANNATIFMTEDSGQSIPITLRVSSAFSPVRNADSAPSVASRGSSESPIHSRTSRPPSVIYPSAVAGSVSGGAKLFVGCLPYSRTSVDLSDLFTKYGPLVEVAMLTTPDGKSKGAAFVTYVDKADAEKAMSSLQGYCFPNSSRGINISFATKQARPGAPPLSTATGLAGKLHTPSPSGSTATTYSSAAHLGEEPLTPPGFSIPAVLHEEQSSYSSFLSAPSVDTSLFGSYTSEDILKYLTRNGDDSPYSILRRGSEEEPTELAQINKDVLNSIFGEPPH